MRTIFWLVPVCVLATFGCNKTDASTGQATATSADTAETPAATEPGHGGGADATALFNSRCAPCHGEHGKGDGPGAVALSPKPRNYSDVAWQGKVTDEDIKKTILYGGAAVGKSPAMPANPDLDGKPELDGLVKKVRSFKGT